MFNVNANTVFNKGKSNSRMMRSMHSQMIRLYQAARELKRTEGQTEVAKLMDALPQTLNNWESRGISDPGLLKAQAAIGCDAIWLRDGTGDMIRGGAEASLHDMSDMVELMRLFAESTPKGKQLILDFARTTPKNETTLKQHALQK